MSITDYRKTVIFEKYTIDRFTGVEHRLTNVDQNGIVGVSKGYTPESTEEAMKIRFQIILTLLLAAVMVLLYALPNKTEEKTYRLPVLMYHHFDETATESTVVSPTRFREQMTALKNAGYTTVTLRQVADFVEHGVPLPEKAVLITMDDGYTSNLIY